MQERHINMLRRSMLTESGAMEADFDADDQGSSFHAGREIWRCVHGKSAWRRRKSGDELAENDGIQLVDRQACSLL